MSDMTDVLHVHTRRTGIRGMAIHCECGWSESILGMRSSKKAFAAHQAAALSAAGFGPVREALDLQQIADVIISRVIYAGNEGWVLTAEDRDDHEYAHCLDAAQEIIDGRTRNDGQ